MRPYRVSSPGLRNTAIPSRQGVTVETCRRRAKRERERERARERERGFQAR
jgi:hypothetical protein